MNVWRYISIFSGILAALSVFLLVLLSNPNKNSKSNRSNKKYKSIYLICIIISIPVLLISIISAIIDNSDLYNQDLNQLWSQASSAGNDGNYLQAASYYELIINQANSSKIKCQAYLYKALCYQQQGYLTQNTDYFQKAIDVYKDLLKYGKFEKHQTVHSQILTGLGFSYICINDSNYISEFEQIIDEMYSFLPLENVDSYNTEALNYCISRSIIQGWYYDILYHNSFNAKYLELSKNCFEEAFFLQSIYDLKNDTTEDFKTFKNLLFVQLGEYYYMLAQSSEGTVSIDYLHTSINFYNEVVFDDNKFDGLLFNAIKAFGLGRSYIGLSYISQVNTAENRWNAYLAVQPYLSLADSNLDKIIQYMAPIAISSGYFTDDDVGYIFARFDRLAMQLTLNDNTDEYIEMKMQKYFTCCFLYGLIHDQSFYKTAKTLYDEFHSVLDPLLSNTQKDDINDIWNEIVIPIFD